MQIIIPEGLPPDADPFVFVEKKVAVGVGFGVDFGHMRPKTAR